jgi:PAS domain S-box-containing protein
MSTVTPALALQTRNPKATIDSHRSKVMVVEDEALIALDIQKQLIQAGFGVTGRAPTAARAFQLIEQETPDIVLMDIKLKGDIDGIQAASIIRSRYALPVIYLTSHSDQATLDRAQATEPYGFLLKPFASFGMNAAITMAVHKHRMERKLEKNPTQLSSILCGLPDAVIVANPTGEILFLNHAAEQCPGWSREESCGRKLAEIARIQDNDGGEVWPSLFQQVMATGTAARIPRNNGLLAKNGELSDVSGKVCIMAPDDESADIFVILLDVTAPKKSDPAQPLKGPSTSTAEWMIALLCLPGKMPEPAGILLLDPNSDHLAVKLKTNVAIEDEIVSVFWNELALDLNQKAQEKGGRQVIEWLEETASHIVRLSPRGAVDLKTASLTKTLDSLYHEHIDPLSSVPRLSRPRRNSLGAILPRGGPILTNQLDR